MRSFTENDPIAFLNQYAEGMLLDEVHHAPNLLSYIQGMVDEDTNRRFVLSGSSQFAMLKKIIQSPEAYRRIRAAPHVLRRNTENSHRYAARRSIVQRILSGNLLGTQHA